MNAAYAFTRELAFRESAGIQVTLLWRSIGNRVWVRVQDVRSDSGFAFNVAPSEALDAFHHPYVYASDADVRAALPSLAC